MDNVFGGGDTDSKAPEQTNESQTPKVEEAEAPAEANVEYVSRGIAKFKIGKFQFENGRLTLSPEKAAELDALLEGDAVPAVIKSKVQKVDKEAGDRVAKEFLASQQGRMMAGVSTTAQSTAPNPLDPNNKPPQE